MQRRSFLALLGLGVPAAALTKTAIEATPTPAAEPPVLVEMRLVNAYRAIDAEVGQVIAGVLRSADGKFEMNFNDGVMRLG
ncbi:hypothetical protein ACVDG5_018240 [Mesorhizobium sp. ORM6]